ncbi:MAG TPA: hypothetical protein VFI75_04480 [Candidatus Acidoferrum sp.]|nr:hypothetical protein [Candidatus Acidoferrum sp.]
MNEPDGKFENFLREFRPRRPRALPSDSARELWMRRLAAAAVLAISLGGVTWFAFSNKRSASVSQLPAAPTQGQDEWRQLSLIQWTRLAEQDPGALEVKLNEASRKSLPAFNEANSSLRALAKP